MNPNSLRGRLGDTEFCLTGLMEGAVHDGVGFDVFGDLLGEKQVLQLGRRGLQLADHLQFRPPVTFACYVLSG